MIEYTALPYVRPTLQTILDSAIADITAAKPGDRVISQNSNLSVMATVLSNMAYSLYGMLDYISLQSLPFTATDEDLAGWAAIKSITRDPASYATGSVTLTGVDGVLLSSGTVLTRSDSVAYTVTTSGTVANGTVTVPIVCQTAGTTGNLPAGITLTLVSGVVGIRPTGTASALVGGAEMETDASLRTRMLDAFASPAQGGSITDFENWTLASGVGVSRVWVVGSLAGAGTVTVFVMFDAAEAANGGFPVGSNGVATAESRGTAATGDQLLVANYIYPLRPVTSLVYVNAPTPYPVNFTISGLTPNTTAIQTGISAALATVFLTNADALGGSIQTSIFDSAISSVAGVTGFTLVSPSASITAPVGSLPVLGSVSYS